MPFLPALKITTVRCYLRLEFPMPVSGFPEATIRGGLGYALRRRYCLFPQRECPGCLLRPTCEFARFFAPGPQQGNSLQGNMQQAPRPWGMFVSQVGDTIQLDITFFGDADKFLNSFLEALVETGRIGVGRDGNRFSIDSVEQPRVADLAQVQGIALGGLRLELLSPMSLRRNGCVVGAWDRQAFAGTLLRRIVSLAAQQNVGMPADFDHKRLLDLLLNARSEGCTVPVRQRRVSTHQKQVLKYNGFIGSVTFGPVTEEAVLLLRAGALLGVGKDTVFGSGRYNVELL